jgi:hypothetical protein
MELLKGLPGAAPSNFLYWEFAAPTGFGTLETDETACFNGSLPRFGLIGTYSAKANSRPRSRRFLLLAGAKRRIPVLDDAYGVSGLAAIDHHEALTIGEYVVLVYLDAAF